MYSYIYKTRSGCHYGLSRILARLATLWWCRGYSGHEVQLTKQILSVRVIEATYIRIDN